MNRAEYQRYLESVSWDRTRTRRLAVAGHRCEFRPEEGYDYPKYGRGFGARCTKTKDLQVHHLHYLSLGAEKDNDLEVLCRFHHLVREVTKGTDCEICGDTVAPIVEEDAIEFIEQAIAEVHGNIDLVDPKEIRDNHSYCSYCNR